MIILPFSNKLGRDKMTPHNSATTVDHLMLLGSSACIFSRQSSKKIMGQTSYGFFRSHVYSFVLHLVTIYVVGIYFSLY